MAGKATSIEDQIKKLLERGMDLDLGEVKIKEIFRYRILSIRILLASF